MSVSNKNLEEARAIAAEIVATYGEKYWPLFEVLDEEWNIRQHRRTRIADCLETTNHARDHEPITFSAKPLPFTF